MNPILVQQMAQHRMDVLDREAEANRRAALVKRANAERSVSHGRLNLAVTSSPRPSGLRRLTAPFARTHPGCSPVRRREARWRSPYHRAMSRRLVSPTLVGRATELAAIARALDSAVAGAADPPAGRGRSRRREVAPRPRGLGDRRTRGMRVLQGGCADIGDGGVPYGPIVEALRTLARSSTRTSSRRSSARPGRDRPARAVARPRRRGADRDADRVTPGAPARCAPRRPPAAVGHRPGPLRHRGPPLGRSRRRARPSRSSSGICGPTASCW